MSDVFLDTVGLVALWDEDDQWHAAADRAFTLITQSRLRMFTTTFVLLECGNAAARRPWRKYVNKLRLDLARTGGLIVPTGEDWEQAWSGYTRGSTEQAGIVDQISFLVMRRLNIPAAFTNDRHFAAAGFHVLF